ncbi:MAG: GNAT family N-acetyltransferase [Brevinema sp.]
MNVPILMTKRLILRKFTENDLKALFAIFSDQEINTFLPWFPLKTMAEARAFYQQRFENNSESPAYHYAICLKTDDFPIGYVKISMDDSYDLGYGLRKEFWHQGIVSEACTALIEQLKKDNIPYITATHDVNNPRSGKVMMQIGMKYCYSYEELWMPKNTMVTFRMYQLNLDGINDRVYTKYWDNSSAHFI